jgi:hypothetical protein
LHGEEHGVIDGWPKKRAMSAFLKSIQIIMGNTERWVGICLQIDKYTSKYRPALQITNGLQIKMTLSCSVPFSYVTSDNMGQ